MTTATLTDTTPRIWVGCLACYNSARLVGAWFAAIEGDDITLADVHGGSQHVRPGCEEIWVMDHENLPFRGECSPHDAAQLARFSPLIRGVSPVDMRGIGGGFGGLG